MYYLNIKLDIGLNNNNNNNNNIYLEMIVFTCFYGRNPLLLTVKPAGLLT